MAKQYLAFAAASCAAAAFLIVPPATAEPAPCDGKTPTVVAAKDGDKLQGTPADEVFSDAGFKDVTVTAAGGNDTICVGLGTNTVEGGDGNDVVIAGTGNDTIDGGDGNDTINSGAGTNTLTGGLGDDTLKGGGTDTLAEPTKQEKGLTIDAGKGTVEGLGKDTFTSIEVHHGSPQKDTFNGSATADVFVGWGDDGDTIVGNAGDDTLTLRGGGSVKGTAGNDKITVENGGSASGGKGNDVISTNIDPKAKVLVDFQLFGDSGNDRIIVRDGSSPTSTPPVAAGKWRGTISGGSRSDLLVLTRLNDGVTANLASGKVTWGSESLATVIAFERMRGSSANDRIWGSAAAESINGKGGDDRLVGRAGNDRLLGGAGADSAFGRGGIDRCVAETERSCER